MDINNDQLEPDNNFTAASLFDISKKNESLLEDSYRKARLAVNNEFKDIVIESIKRVAISAAKEGHVSKSIPISYIPYKLSLSEASDIILDIMDYFFKKDFDINIITIVRGDFVKSFRVGISWDLEDLED